MSKLIFEKETFAIIGAAMEVHTQLGNGFLEAVYQEALELEMTMQNIPHESQKMLNIVYKGHPLKKTYVADLVCFGQVIVELKALDRLTSTEEAQILNYLKTTGLKIGLLINFGAKGKLEYKRFVL